jgi:lipopolysaccharide biosynthesis glycosyltransferase
MEMEAANKGELHVVTCADRRFAIGAWITIWSTYRRTPENKNLRFHLLTTDSNAAEFEKVLTLAAKWGIALSIKRATEDSVKDLPTHRLPISSYLRLLAPGMLQGVKQFLYLDSDVLVRSSVQPLFNLLGENAVAAAARDYFFYDILGSGLHERSPELAKHEPYFNSGVIQVNVEAWRDRKVSERAMAYLDFHGSAVSHGDQDALNVVLTGQLEELDFSWNVQIGAIQYYDRVGWRTEREPLRARKAELLKDPKIVHFIGKAKPWYDGLTLPYGKEYRKALADSGWIPRHLVIPWTIGWLASAIRATIRRRLGRS